METKDKILFIIRAKRFLSVCQIIVKSYNMKENSGQKDKNMQDK